jgi:hypothetical protein
VTDDTYVGDFGMSYSETLLACPRAEVTLERITQLVELGGSESITHEFKEKYTPGAVEAVCSMANTYGGIVVIGVKDTGANRIVGVPKSETAKIVDACYSMLEPPFEPEIIEVPLASGEKILIVLRVDSGRALVPMTVSGVTYVRLTGRKARATRDQIISLTQREISTVNIRHHTVPMPMYPTLPDGLPYEDLIFRSGFAIPMSESAGWESFSECSIDRMIEVLNTSELHSVMVEWLKLLGMNGFVPFRRKGHNRARSARVQWWAGTSNDPPFPLVSTVSLIAPIPTTVPATTMNLTVDVAVRIRGDVGIQGSFPNARVPIELLDATISGVVATLVDPRLVAVLAELGDIDPALVPQPFFAHLVTGRPVTEILAGEGLSTVLDNGSSMGAQLTARPGFNLRDPVERRAQIDGWLVQIGLDAGFQGMAEVVRKLRA